MFPQSPVAVLLVNYALGCVAVAWYAVKWRTGNDLRRSGSGNVGARNAGRQLGRTGFLLVALADIAKGFAAMWLAQRAELASGWLVAAGLAVVAGHLWPVQLGFRGGKGMATAWGVQLQACPAAALAMLALFGVLRLRALGGSSLPASLAAFAFEPLLAALLDGRREVTLLYAVLAGVVIVTHRTNLLEYFAGVRRAPSEAAPSPPRK